MRTFTLFVPTQLDTVGPITVDVRLRYRAFPPFLVRIVEDVLDRSGLIPNLEIIDIHENSTTVEVEH